MSKAEPIEHEGYEVPNWVLRCKSIITSGPVLGIVTLGLLVIVGLGYWNHGRPSYSDTTQTIPDSSNSLNVIPSNLNLPTAATANDYSPVGLSGNVAGRPTNTPVGPAPTNSLQSLQPTGMLNNTTGATNTPNESGTASDALMQKLGL